MHIRDFRALWGECGVSLIQAEADFPPPYSLSIDANGSLPWSGLKNRVLLVEEDGGMDFLSLLPDHLATEVQRAYRWLKGSALATILTR